jgi:hypothetical protein
MSYEQLTAKHLGNLQAKIVQVLANKNIDSTGEASASLEVKGSQLLGADYIYYLDQGRRPGKFPPISNIRSWIRSKLNIPIEEESAAIFLIGRKISKEGTEIFKHPNKGLQLQFLVEETIDELIKELPDEVAVEALKWL